MDQFRTEKDSLGEVKVPQKALYQAQTQRALDNFPISHRTLPWPFHRALIQLKLAAARVNADFDKISAAQQQAIEQSASTLLSGEHRDQLCVDVYQTGSGTSTNMNVNEVLATLASQQCDEPVHPNDHINASQSSNDVIPTSLQLSAVSELNNQLLPALKGLIHALEEKAKSLKDKVKTGRTHLMDAMPITLAQEFGCWQRQLTDNQTRLTHCQKDLLQLPIGGTAVGTGVNCPDGFDKQICEHLSGLTELNLVPCDNKFSRIASQDGIVALSGQLNTLAVSLMKIANDLRWMNSGPLAGLSEISLEAIQPGSSIMPGKVNPVVPEAAAMVSAKVMGNHQTITIAGQSGNFQLNVMLPLLAECVLDSLQLLASIMPELAKTISDLSVNDDKLSEPLEKNPILVTALNERIGYEKAAAIAKKAYADKRPVFEVAREMTDLDEQELKELLDPKKLT
ncbi:Fumarate hydratase [Saliniradius amylolyticus]|uniref:fumarate hydratase n=1 Tax=Saliniradius amylolyticus TaxID=2183582 RepID=A0A2S2E1G9_9ALTE|nr:class II fumarate hydratase [Saliniradius amylolyticus]AWL11110.1 Fumarate hydratase [Saliniradius amylolyticus]